MIRLALSSCSSLPGKQFKLGIELRIKLWKLDYTFPNRDVPVLIHASILLQLAGSPSSDYTRPQFNLTVPHHLAHHVCFPRSTQLIVKCL